eukprot:6189999-Pleurochrysis_carterae.AAC.2
MHRHRSSRRWRTAVLSPRAHAHTAGAHTIPTHTKLTISSQKPSLGTVSEHAIFIHVYEICTCGLHLLVIHMTKSQFRYEMKGSGPRHEHACVFRRKA